MGTPIPGTIIAAKVTTGNTDNTFAIADLNEAQGGMHLVDSVVERDAITTARRSIGMTCWVRTPPALYRLVGGITNSDWVLDTAFSVGTLPYDLMQEENYRVLGEGTLMGSIAAVQTEVFGNLVPLINAEVTARVIADGTLMGSIAAVQTEVFQNLVPLINAEVTARVVADGTMMEALAQEQAYRVIADGTLMGSLTAVSDSVFNNLVPLINAEVTARVIADGTLMSDLMQEENYRVIADGTLVDRINSLTVQLLAQSSPFPDVGNRLISGGETVWVDGYTFAVGTTTVSFNGTSVYFPGTSFTLASADPSDDRIDLIVADRASDAVIPITGAVSTPAVPPDYDPIGQFQLTFIPVDAGSVQPGDVSNTWIYRENTEWTWAASATFNPNSTTSPYQGAKAIEATNPLNGHYFRLAAVADFSLDNYTTLYLYIKPKAPFGTSYVRLNWTTNGNARLGNYVNIADGFFGFNSSSSIYQLVAIPLSLFAVPVGTTTTRKLQATVVNAMTGGFFMDDIAIQTGIEPPPAALPIATTTQRGIVELATNGEIASGLAVQANDGRLGLYQEMRYRAVNDGTLAAAIVTEAGIRSTADGTLTTNLNTTNSNLSTTTTTANNAWELANQLAQRSSVGLTGTYAAYFSFVRYGKPDLKLSVVGGVVSGVEDSKFVWDDFSQYSVGLIGTSFGDLGLGTGWNGTGVIFTDTLFGLKAYDTLESYTVGTITMLDGGVGFSGTGNIQDPYSRLVGTESFEDYMVGPITDSGTLTGGWGWAGTITIV